jgi:hypothetical protein
MSTLRSGYEFEAPQSSSNARRHLAYVDTDALEALHNAAATCSSILPIQEDTITPTYAIQSSYTTKTFTPRPEPVYNSNIELVATNPQHDTTNATEPEFTLPPVDGGKDAWLFLFSAFVLEILVWGNFCSPISSIPLR